MFIWRMRKRISNPGLILWTSNSKETPNPKKGFVTLEIVKTPSKKHGGREKDTSLFFFLKKFAMTIWRGREIACENSRLTSEGFQREIANSTDEEVLIAVVAIDAQRQFRKRVRIGGYYEGIVPLYSSALDVPNHMSRRTVVFLHDLLAVLPESSTSDTRRKTTQAKDLT